MGIREMMLFFNGVFSPNCIQRSPSIYRKSLQESLLERWRPKGRVEIKEIGGDLFMFTFSLMEDKAKVIRYGSWIFDKALVLLEEPDAVTVQSKIRLHHADF